MDALALTGRSRSHIRTFDKPRFDAHPLAADAFLEMRAEAVRAGFDLFPFSVFRDFESQARIWNLKYSGERRLLDREGKPFDSTGLDEAQRICRILDWTALPGASRHHWGTDFDVIDKAALPQGVKVRLLPEETAEGGPFFRLHGWLNENMGRFGFFRPYATDQNGVCPEPWHLSFAPVSKTALSELTLDRLREAVASGMLLGKERVLEMLPEIFRDYVCRIDDRGL